MTHINITKASKDDMEDILALQYLAYKSEAELVGSHDIPPLTQTLDELINEYEGGIVLKAINDDNQVIGSVRGYMEEETLYIGKLIVHPDIQGKGIGTCLLQEIEKTFPQLRCELFTSTKSIRNVKLYERARYVKYKTETISPDLEFVYLEKYLLNVKYIKNLNDELSELINVKFSEFANKNKGFKHMDLTTYHFQAPEFYKKCGFQIEFAREDTGNLKLTKYFLIKYFNS